MLLEHEQTALVVVDIQGRLAREVVDSARLLKQIKTLIQCAKLLELPIVWLEQYPQGLGHTVEELAELMQSDSPLEKTHFNALHEAPVVEAIKNTNKTQFMLCGIEAHVCVWQTAVGLLQLGYDVTVIEDCCSSRTLMSKAAGLQRMRDVGVSIKSLEMCVFELVKDAANPLFKKILPLIK